MVTVSGMAAAGVFLFAMHVVFQLRCTMTEKKNLVRSASIGAEPTQRHLCRPHQAPSALDLALRAVAIATGSFHSSIFGFICNICRIQSVSRDGRDEALGMIRMIRGIELVQFHLVYRGIFEIF